MTTFQYEAARGDGAVVRGMLEAATIPEIVATLTDRGLFPVSVEVREATRPREAPTRLQATVLQSLASLVEAGVPLQQALAVTERVAHPSLREPLSKAATRVREGASLATALASTDAFSRVAIGLIKGGEGGVGLGSGLTQAAAYLDRRAETAARIRAALAYPLLLAAVGTCAVAAIVLIVIPRFATLLGDVGQTLPLATRLLLGASGFAQHFGWLLGMAAVAATFLLARSIHQQREWWHSVLLRVPLVGPVRRGFGTARAARTLGALLGGGTPALTALEIAREASGDAAIARDLLDAKGRVAQGASLSAALSATRCFTPAALQLASIGDQAGQLPTLLARAADLEEREAERRLHVLVSFLEPGLILVFAALVAFVAAALLQAVYSLRPGVG